MIIGLGNVTWRAKCGGRLLEDKRVISTNPSDEDNIIIPVHAKTMSGVRLLLSYSVHSVSVE